MSMKNKIPPPDEPQAPRITSILGVDHIAALTFYGPLAGWILVALLALIPDVRPILSGSGQGPGFLFIVVFLTAAGWGTALMRVYAIRALFNRGVPAAGQVCRLRSSGTLIHVDYRYSFHGRPYESSADLLAGERTRQIKVGDAAALLVDPERPNQALIQDLYF
jgi:hypothetical protein